MNDDIEWLNSLEIPSCSLVTSIEDLKSGVVLCDLAAYIKSRCFFEDVQRHGSVQKNFRRAAINNFKIFYREIGSRLPNWLLRAPEDLCEDSETLHDILKHLKSLIRPKNKEKSFRNLTPSQRVISPPRVLTHRLQHSPSMLDIHMQDSTVSISTKEAVKNWLVELRLIKNDVVEELKDGIVLCELINRLEGRVEVIKGYQKNPKNKSAVQVNINKALSFLRTIEKLNSKYLWSTNEIMQGDEEAIYGILMSIKEAYSVNRSASTSRSVKNISNKTLSNIFYEVKPEPETFSVRTWVSNMGLGKFLAFDKKHFLDDPCRNGVLLAEFLSKTEGVEIPGVSIPKSLAAAQSNYEKCLKWVNEKYPSIGSKYLKEADAFIESDSFLWKLIEELIAVPRGGGKLNSDLPYPQEQILALEASLTGWVSQITSRAFDSFEEIGLEVSTGILLSEIVAKSGFSITGITKNPKTVRVRQSNIEKSLECLRKVSRMSQKFLWKSEEVSEGNTNVIVGLLEDIHRFYDGLPPRKRGPNYHIDGPYLGKSVRTKVSPLRNISSLLNKSYESPKSNRKVDIIPRQKILNFDKIPNNEFDWIYSLGLSSFDVLGDEIEEFKSGVLLCQIVEKLERKIIPGIEGKVKSNAVALYNVGKAMKILKEKPTFPSSLMFVDEDVVKGKGEVIRNLLRAIYKVYRQTIKTQMKFSAIEKGNQSYLC